MASCYPYNCLAYLHNYVMANHNVTTTTKQLLHLAIGDNYATNVRLPIFYSIYAHSVHEPPLLCDCEKEVLVTE